MGICIFFIGFFSKNEHFSTLKKLKWAKTIIHSPHYPKYSYFSVILGNYLHFYSSLPNPVHFSLFFGQAHPLFFLFAQISPLLTPLWAIFSSFVSLCPNQKTPKTKKEGNYAFLLFYYSLDFSLRFLFEITFELPLFYSSSFFGRLRAI